MHIPVLQKEVIEYLTPGPNENFIDCTIGEGGHASAILEKIKPDGKVLGIDLNIRFKGDKRLILAEDNFTNLKEIVEKIKFGKADGILMDLGFSSWHLEESGRGFSFQKQEPLDMRYNLENQLTAEKILNFWSAPEIERILKEYGEEKFAKEIAREIINSRQIRPIQNTFQLVAIIRRVVPAGYQRQKIHPATRTFQALRIAVNDELNNLQAVLPEALDILKKGGRIAVISFHSLEDRIIKNFLRDEAKENLISILTKKPVTATFQEIKINPRARSAKLRAAQKI
ncbi:MAG: 16S rRNA (cytosine(1402)-N(4))-methyltransferase [Candidatus Nealsonbacteria bacterium RIFCSPLOWO2_01_FULL_41_9]|uniref:Ribosomal RNA small subunit methyltransferase H n=1 Tax=Candidatus Nealsonbacteria bacterium RIFCSPLOWO2_01_FULL_41_9 TaxID=1801671 RepID=A0A1G2EDA0_9BACT|nr:MAG: 16S rRNA (cytosine(1402)-N(4))-methyltransferase [Candidatus Nealsonbacteria bacterium RIFCSPLOWO2_01_FULL_41_9]